MTTSKLVPREPTQEHIRYAHKLIEAELPEDEPDLVPDWVCSLLIRYGMNMVAAPEVEAAP